MVVLGAMSLGVLSASANPAGVLPDSTYACAFTGAAGPISNTGEADVTPVPAEGGATGVQPILDYNNGIGGVNRGDAFDPNSDGDDFLEVLGPPGVLLNDATFDQDVGTYSFTTAPGVLDAICVHVDGDTPNGSGVYDVDIMSQGTYQNSICGTGTARGNPGATSVPFNAIIAAPPGSVLAASEGPISDVEYDIAFVASNGVLKIHNATNDDSATPVAPAGGLGPAGGPPPGALDESGGGIGAVHISPNPVLNDPGDTPDPGGPPDIACVNDDVDDFTVAGAFVVTLDDGVS